jgi:6-phosphogluconolactonase
MKLPPVVLVPVRAAAVLSALALSSPAQSPGVVFTQTNAPNGNMVLEYQRAPSGQLTFVAALATGGLGSGTALGSQGAVTLSAPGKLLFVVNAGDDSVSVFRREALGWVLSDVEPTLGGMPISVAQRHDRVYVLNGGAPANVSGFELSPGGQLDPIAGAVQPLSSPDPMPAQVMIGPGGAQVFVTEKMTNKIDLFPVAPDGALGPGAFLDSAGMTPFGFGFGLHDTLIVSEAFGGAVDASATSSYRIGAGALQVVSASVPTTETAACWIVVTRNGRYAYATNTDSGSVTGYSVSMPSGALTRLDPDGVTGFVGPGSNPIDEALSADSRWLYVLSPMTSEIAIFRVRDDGSLERMPSELGLPASAVGLAAR